MNAKRCKHGMLEEQCGVCKRWEENCWEKKKDSKPKEYKMNCSEES